MTGIWVRLATWIDAADAMHGVGRWIVGAALWGGFVLVCASPMVCAYLLGRATQ